MSSSEEVEKAEVFTMPKYRIRFTDMPLEIVENIVRICEEVNKKHPLDKLVATEIQNRLCDDSLT